MAGRARTYEDDTEQRTNDHDLVVELRSDMKYMKGEMASARADIRELTTRVVSPDQLAMELQPMRQDIRELKADRDKQNERIQFYVRFFVTSFTGSLITTAIVIYFASHGFKGL